MRGVGHELPLPLPGELHRPHRPARQQQAYDQKDRKAQRADEQAVFHEVSDDAPLAGHVRKDDVLRPSRPDPAIAQAVVLQHAGVPVPGLGQGEQFFQQLAVREVVVAAPGVGYAAVLVQLQREKWQTHALRTLVRPAGAHRFLRQGLHHADALPLEVRAREEKHHGEDGAEHQRDDGHVYAHEFEPQPPYQAPCTSR